MGLVSDRRLRLPREGPMTDRKRAFRTAILAPVFFPAIAFALT